MEKLEDLESQKNELLKQGSIIEDNELNNMHELVLRFEKADAMLKALTEGTGVSVHIDGDLEANWNIDGLETDVESRAAFAQEMSQTRSRAYQECYTRLERPRGALGRTFEAVRRKKILRAPHAVKGCHVIWTNRVRRHEASARYGLKTTSWGTIGSCRKHKSRVETLPYAVRNFLFLPNLFLD